ncbi:MAG: ABC transporter transmembrane domain-containing protein, partial [Candidatus Binatia bacterium]
MKEFAVFKRLLPHLRLHSWAFPTVITLGFLSSLAEGIGISLFIPFLHSVNQTNYDPNTGNWLVDTLGELFNHMSPDYRLLILCVCIFGSVLLRSSLSYGSGVLFSWLDTSIVHRMRSALFEQFLTVSYRFLERTPSGKLMNVLKNETAYTSKALKCLVDSIIISFTLGVYITLLLLISWRLTLLVTVVMLVISFVVQLLTQRVRSLGMRRKQADASLSFRILEGLGGMEVIRTLSRESYEQQRFDQTSEGVSKALMQIKIFREAVDPIYEVLVAAVLVSILFSTLQAPGNLAPLLVFIFVLFRLQPKIKKLHQARADLNSYAAAVEEVTSLLDRTDKPY